MHWPKFQRPTLGLILTLAVSLPFLGDLFVVGERARASIAEPVGGPLRIISPAEAAVLGDGNLLLVETIATDPADGVADRVEIAIDGDQEWAPAERDASDPTRWRYLWADPSRGFHQVRARAFGIEDHQVVEQQVTVRVADQWSTTFIVDNPYASAGTYFKGQMHMHTSASFDNWTALPPAYQALEYKKAGYHFVVITDHDVVAYPQELNDGSFLVIPGYESTAESGHIVAAFTREVVSPALPPQERIDAITAAGGIAILAHPGWRVGWSGTQFTELRGFTGFEIFNGITSDPREGAQRNAGRWQQVLNAKGRSGRVWAVAVDDAHLTNEMGRGWVMVKAAELTEGAIRQSIERGAFYASSGPSFRVLGVLNGAITASSPDAATIRFIDQDANVVSEGPGSWAGYRPRGSERWVRVEAVAADGRRAWSQPFWLIPNAPTADVVARWDGMALAGQTIPRARVHVSDNGQYLGNVVAADDGGFIFNWGSFAPGTHDLWLVATSPWEQIDSPPMLLAYRQ